MACAHYFATFPLLMTYSKKLKAHLASIPPEAKDFLLGWLMLGVILTWIAPAYRLSHGQGQWGDVGWLVVTVPIGLALALRLRVRVLSTMAKLRKP